MVRFAFAVIFLLCAGNLALAQHVRVRVEYVSVETVTGGEKPKRLPPVEGASREVKLVERLSRLDNASQHAELIELVKKGRVIKQDTLVGVLRPEEAFELQKTQDERDFIATGKVNKLRNGKWQAKIKLAWQEETPQRNAAGEIVFEPQGLETQVSLASGEMLLGDLVRDYRQKDSDIRVHTLVFIGVEDVK